MKDKKHTAGFTLLEVLIAIAIFAVAAGAIIKEVSQTTNQAAELEQKNIAWWIAENQMNTMLASEAWPTPGREALTVSQAGQEWTLEITVQPTSQPDLRRVEIAVFREDSEQLLANLIGFKGRW
jgi:general secretion pathway protein I